MSAWRELVSGLDKRYNMFRSLFNLSIYEVHGVGSDEFLVKFYDGRAAWVARSIATYINDPGI